MEPIQVLVKLSQNVAVLLALTFIYGLIAPSFKRIPSAMQKVLQGVVFGLFGVVTMMTAVELSPGIIFDGRSIVVAIAGVFGGGIPAFIAAALVATYRIVLGGAGAPAGAVSIFLVAALGFGMRVFLRRHRRAVRWHALLLLGFAVAGVVLMTIGIAGGSRFLGVLAGPIILLYPMGILMLGALMAREQRQREVEEALRHSEDRYRSVIEAMSEGVVVRDMEGNIHTHNRSAELLLGLSEDDLKHGHEEELIQFMIHEDGSPVGDDSLTVNLIRAGDERRYKSVRGIYRPDGTLVWLLVSSRPLNKPGSTQPYAMVTTFTDITARKQAEETTGRERDRLRALIDSTPDYIFIKDAQGRFEVSNVAHAQAVHVEADELTGKTAFDVFPMEMAAQFHYDDMAVIRSGQPLFNLERTTIDGDGNYKTVLTSKVPLRDREGKVTGLVGISRDITERKLMERQSVELDAERQRVKVLRQFITSISHDFRTPLTSINNHIYLMEKSADAARQKEHREIIEAQVMRMSNMLDEMLQMEHLEREEQPYVFSPVSVNVLTGEAVQASEYGCRETADPHVYS